MRKQIAVRCRSAAVGDPDHALPESAAAATATAVSAAANAASAAAVLPTAAYPVCESTGAGECAGGRGAEKEIEGPAMVDGHYPASLAPVRRSTDSDEFSGHQSGEPVVYAR